MRLFSTSFAILAGLSLSAGACGNAEESEGLQRTDTSPTMDAGSSTVSEPPDSGEAAAIPAQGLRSDWFDVFAKKAVTRFDVPAVIAHDDATPPAAGVRGTLYSARFSGHLTVPASGEVSFFTTADDGVRLFVDDKAVIDDWKEHPPTEATGKVTLTAGEHELRLEYFQMLGGATLSLAWQPPNGARGPIPLEALRPSATAPDEAPRPLFSNPVVPFDCPDPGVTAVPGAHPLYVMVCTGGPMRVRVSDDLVHWRDSANDLLPGGKAPWSANGFRNWAPEVHRVGTGYVAYYTAVNAADKLSIGCAYASSPTGPFTNCGGPLVEHPQGAIDATFFEDKDGKRYLYWKVDGNSVGQATPIFVRELSSNGRSFAPGSAAVQVLTNNAATWEGGVVEAPWVIAHGGEYFMFYSGNVYDDRYRTGVARAKSPKGPFTKKSGPILGNNAQWVGPGHGSVLTVNGREVFFHHAWPALPNGKHDEAKGRFGLLAPITWGADGWPAVANGTPVTTPMPWP